MIGDGVQARAKIVPGRMRWIYIFVHIFLLVRLSLPVQAQDPEGFAQPLKGVVWQEPDDPVLAAADIRRMADAGVTAVRTEPIRSSGLLALTDTLGLVLLQDLPLRNLPATRLRDTLQYAVRVLEPLLRRSRRSPSATSFGLVTNGDTSDSLACEYLAQAAAYVRSHGPPQTRVYYTTRFIEDDVCGATVDFVLLETLDRSDPLELLRRWRRAHPDVSIGIASIGTWTAMDRRQGLDVSGSPEAQARHLEHHLRRLFALQPEYLPTAVFVYRWRDILRRRPSPAFDLADPYRDAFGLHALSSEPRLSMAVVEGIYTGSQTVFAFPAGRPRPGPPSVSTIAGWLVIVALGIFYFASARFRQMVPRYFGARGFYREGIREGRDVLLLAGALLLGTFSVAFGIIITVALDALRAHPAFLLLHEYLPEPIGETLVTLMGQPWMLLLILSCVYAATVTIWGAGLAFVARNRYRLTPAQAVILTTWPRWPLLLVMLAAMAVATLDHGHAFLPALYLIVGWFVVTIAAAIRALSDYRAIARVSAARLLSLTILNPFVLLLLTLCVLAVRFQPEVAYLWHAVSRT